MIPSWSWFFHLSPSCPDHVTLCTVMCDLEMVLKNHVKCLWPCYSSFNIQRPVLPVSEECVAVGFHQDFQRAQAGAMGERGKDLCIHSVSKMSSWGEDLVCQLLALYAQRPECDSQHRPKMSGVVVTMPMTPALRRQWQTDPRDSLASQPSQLSKLQTQWETLSLKSK